MILGDAILVVVTVYPISVREALNMGRNMSGLGSSLDGVFSERWFLMFLMPKSIGFT